MYWANNSVPIGDVSPRSEVKVQFHALDDIPPIVNIIPGCGCSDFRYDKEEKILHVTYKVERFPYHLRNQPTMEVRKNFKIEYEGNKGYDTLEFTGRVVK